MKSRRHIHEWVIVTFTNLFHSWMSHVAHTLPCYRLQFLTHGEMCMESHCQIHEWAIPKSIHSDILLKMSVVRGEGFYGLLQRMCEYSRIVYIDMYTYMGLLSEYTAFFSDYLAYTIPRLYSNEDPVSVNIYTCQARIIWNILYELIHRSLNTQLSVFCQGKKHCQVYPMNLY